MILAYPFSEAEAKQAYDEWGANCGPNALAFALQVPLTTVRGKIPGFDEKGYTSPTMMKAGVEAMGKKVNPYPFPLVAAAWFAPRLALVRVQWTGPWTAPTANPKWAYWHTHWIVCWKGIVLAAQDMSAAAMESGASEEEVPTVFDCNGGIRSFQSWKDEIVPLLTGSIKRADGGWLPTHVWRID